MAHLLPSPKMQFFDLNGDPLSGGKVNTYEAGTSTRKATYTTAAEAVANANPVVLDSRGEAAIFWSTGSYKIVLTDSDDAEIYTVDAITLSAAGTAGASFRAGTGVPSNSLGSNGDRYLRADTGQIYLKDAGTYSVESTISLPATTIVNTPSGNLAAVTVQAALNELQTELDTASAHVVDATDAHAGTAITNTPSGNLAATTVQAALNELQTELDSATAHISDATDAHAGTAITNTPSGNLVATTVQAALNELQTELDTATAHVSDATDAHAGTAITNTPSGNLAATTVQAALDELQTDVDTRISALTGDVTASGGGSQAATIANDAVTNAKLANAAAWTIKIRNAGTTGDMSDAALADITEEATPAALDFVLGFLATGEIRKFDVANISSGGGGGGGSLRFVEGANSPIKTFENEIEVYEYEPGMGQALYLAVRVPSTYLAGSPINLRILWTCAATSGDALINAVATLIRSEVDEITSTTNQRTTTNTAITLSATNDLEPQKIDLDITDAFGDINGTGVSAGDLIKVKIQESSSTVGSVIKLIPDASEVSFS